MTPAVENTTQMVPVAAGGQAVAGPVFVNAHEAVALTGLAIDAADLTRVLPAAQAGDGALVDLSLVVRPADERDLGQLGRVKVIERGILHD